MSEADNKQEVEGATPESTETKDDSADESAASAAKSGVTNPAESQSKPKFKYPTESSLGEMVTVQGGAKWGSSSNDRLRISGSSRPSGGHSKRHRSVQKSGTAPMIQQLSQVSTSDSTKIGFVGAGKAAESIINGLVIFGKMDPTRIHVSAPSTFNTDRFKNNHPGLKVTKRNLDIFGKFNCDIIFIAVNGNVMRNLYKLGGIRPAPLITNYIPNMKHKFYVLSLVTGYDLKSIKDVLVNPEHPDKHDLEIHRIVMNCGAGYGIGICAIDCDPDDSAKLGQPVRSLLSMVAKLEYIPEKEMDAASAVCGAGLAFSYYFINAMSDGALKIGMGRAEAIKFVAKSVNCATQTLLKSRKHPNELKDEVCAPLGCGTYGLTILDKADVASGVSGAVEAAHKRAMSLAKEDNPA